MNSLSNQQNLLLQQKINEYERVIAEKNIYLAKLELDLEHAISQCKKIAADKIHTYSSSSSKWISRHEPGVESKG